MKVRHRGTDGQGKQQGLLPLRPLMPVSVREPGAHFRAGGGGPIHLLDHAHDWRCGTSFIFLKSYLWNHIAFPEKAQPQVAAGSWSTWTGWTGCSVTCDSGTRVRHRSCQNGTCHEGMANSEEACNLGPCSNYKRHIIDVDFKTLRRICRERGIQATRRHLGILDCLDFLLRHLRIRDQDEAQGLSARVPMPGAVRITRGLQSGSMR